MSISKGKLIAGGVLTYGFAVGAGYLYAQSNKRQEDVPFNPNIVLDDKERIKSFDNNAKKYDSGIF
jgi:hypothetical protein